MRDTCFVKLPSFGSFYQKSHCSCYFLQKKTLLFGMPALSPWWDCPLPASPHPASASPSHPGPSSRNDSTSYNLLTRTLLTKMIRDHFQASVPLTGQTGTFPLVSQLTARGALISSGLEECRAVGGEGCLPHLPWPRSTKEVKEHLTLWRCESSSPPWWERFSPPPPRQAPIRSSSASPPAAANLRAVWC